MLDDPANKKFVDEISLSLAEGLVGQDGKAPEIDVVDKRSEARQMSGQSSNLLKDQVSLGGSKKGSR